MTLPDDATDRPGPNERLVHGLLATLALDHAAVQDRRVRAAIARIDRRDSVLARIGRFGLARFAAAGALAATLTIAVVLSIGPATNSAYATLQSISNRLATGNRSYRQTIVLAQRDGTETLREAMVDVGTGRRFVFAIDLDALPTGTGGRGEPGSHKPLMPGMRGRRGPEGPDGPERGGPGRPEGSGGPDRPGPDGPGAPPHEHRGAPPVAWGFDGNDYWQVDLTGAITRSAEPLRMRDPMALMGAPTGATSDEDEDEELLTLQPLLDRLDSGYDLNVVAGAQARSADGSPLVVIEATLRADAAAAARAPTAQREPGEREGPSIRKGRRSMHAPPLPARVRLVADAQTNELVSVIADWPDGNRFLRRIVVERVAPRAADDAWFRPDQHVPGGSRGALGESAGSDFGPTFSTRTRLAAQSGYCFRSP